MMNNSRRSNRIEITVRNQTRQRLPLAFFRRIAREASDAVGMHGGALGIVFVGETLMARYAKRYARKRRATNVLSFPYGGRRTAAGDIVLCVPLARREAKDLGRTLKQHLAFLLIHSIVHLSGQTHETPRAAEKMEATERRIARKLQFINS